MPIGEIDRRVFNATGSEIYGEYANDPDERFYVDGSIVGLNSGAQVEPGLSGGSDLLPPPHIVDLVEQLEKQPGAVAFGAESGRWRQGIVTGLWPRTPRGKWTGLCWIQQDPPSIKGDSGGVWMLESPEGHVGFGLHRGSVGSHAIVTDLGAALRMLGGITLSA